MSAAIKQNRNGSKRVPLFLSPFRYNNPHKLSLYLAVGLPVIIWSEAAEADFVLQENVGIVVDSLKELADKLKKVDKVRYNEMRMNAKCVSKKLRNGDFLLSAISQAEEKIDCKNI